MANFTPGIAHLHPRPRALRMTSQRLELAGRGWIRVPQGFSPRLLRALGRFRDALEADRRAGATPIEITFGTPSPGRTLLTIEPLAARMPHEGYRLTCRASGISLEARDEAGVHHGLTTCLQLLRGSPRSVPGCTIADHPDLSVRGVMLDISRCKVPTRESLHRYVDQLAGLKINQLQLYTEHTFAFSNHEAVWRDASPLTSSDVVDLDHYCRERFIELVPNLNSFGHMERWLRHPEYKRLAECPDGFEHPLGGRIPFGSTLTPGRASLTLLRELYAEYLPNFTSEQMNIGCDETWELGMGRSRNRCRRLGTTGVYLDFVLQVARIAERHGRNPLMWGDIVLKEPAAIERLPATITLLNWGYEADHPFPAQCRVLAGSGRPFYVCPGTSSWNSLTGRSLNARTNLLRAARSGIRNGAAGLLVTDWGDHGHHQYAPISYPALVLGAAFAWCLNANAEIDPADGTNRAFIGDPNSRLGQVLWSLGQLDQTLGRVTRNGTLFNRFLFGSLARTAADLEGLDPRRLDRCRDELARLSREVERDSSATHEAELTRAELRNAIAMTAHAIDRARYAIGPRRGRARMGRELAAVIAEHERLWLLRNRPGGLAESVSHLTRGLAALRG